tara:strand:+ start:167 stop:349 length:183 start_codon:yes stop_codon:yes gene_type:complete
MKQYDPVSHPKYGKGHVLHIQYRKDNNLLMMIYINEETKEITHDWMLESDAVKLKVEGLE